MALASRAEPGSSKTSSGPSAPLWEPDFALGVRLNMEEKFPGGYDLDEGVEVAKRLEATGQIDYISCVVGNNWGAPSYLQTHHYGEAEWSSSAARFRQALSVPVVYAGRVTHPALAAEVIRNGHADVVGIARAMFADGQFLSKARAGRLQDIRPCIGTNDCIHRVMVERLRFGCSVNPHTGQEGTPAPSPTSRAKAVLVAGGGPAGLELAAQLAERGHRVALWEREGELGGQMRVAARVRENGAYGEYIAFQTRRLDSLGVEVHTGLEATPDNVRQACPDVLAVATGSTGRRPEIPGVHLPVVLEGRDVLEGKAEAGDRVVVIAMEDHMQPLTIAGFLTDLGKHVQLVYSTPSIAPLVGKYSLGAPLAKLSAAGAAILVTTRAVSIDEDRVLTRNTYSGVDGELTGYDSVVLACGGRPDSRLYDALKDVVPETHLLGDAYAPRRISFATRQAYALARKI